LEFRRACGEFFAVADYAPLRAATGSMAERICAFTRHGENRWVVALAPRLVGELVYNGGAPIGEIWGESVVALPLDAPRKWIDIISGMPVETDSSHRLMLNQVFKYFPISLLYHEEITEVSSTVQESLHATATQPVG
jgi:maltooligosyltrehalose synthase